MKHKEKSREKTINVLAAVRIARASGRDNLNGIFRFVEQNSSWQLHLVQYNEEFSPEVVRSAKDKGFDGIIATIPGSDATIAIASVSSDVCTSAVFVSVSSVTTV